jgi:hypothetical protein
MPIACGPGNPLREGFRLIGVYMDNVLLRGVAERDYRPERTQELTGMNLKRAPRDRSPRLELLDALMDSYVQWRDESRAVAESYRDWHSAAAPHRDAAFDDYLAALDREEDAACDYRRNVEQTHGYELAGAPGRRYADRPYGGQRLVAHDE